MVDSPSRKGGAPSSASMRLAVLALALLVLGPAGTSVGAVHPMVGFSMFVLAGLVGLVGALIAAGTYRRHRTSGHLLSGLLGLIPVAAVVGPAALSAGAPPIHDITTDLDAPPAFVAAAALPANAGRDMGLAAEGAKLLRHGYPDLGPAHSNFAPTHSFARVIEVAHGMADWDVHHVDAATMRLEAVATTGVFRFPDDVVIEVRPAKGGQGSAVHMRSRSRYGKGDLGVNAGRIYAFQDALGVGFEGCAR